MAQKKYKKKIQTKPEWCKGCRICVSFCPKSCLDLDGNEKIKMIQENLCIRCGMCESFCPDFAIFLVDDTEYNNDNVELGNTDKIID